MRPTAPVIHPEAVEILPGAATRSHGELRMYPPIPNVISQFRVRHGDVARAFATAHKIFEHRFAVPTVHQGYIEPHTCLVSIGADGLVDVWIANKGPHIARAHMAGAIGVLTLAACIAGFIPARRAASINPVQALRVD